MSVVLVVTSAPPLVEGGHMVIARSLEQALVEAGHHAAIVATPSNRFGRQASAYVANWLTDVGRTGDGRTVDHVISLRYPSYAVRHPSHVCWLNHTMREYYDLWDEFSARLSPQGLVKEQVRRMLIHGADNYLLKHNVTRLYAQSETVRGRLRAWNRLDAEVIHPPAPRRAYRCDAYDDFMLVVGRLSPTKRVDLVLRALREPAAQHVRCVIAGDGEARRDLEMEANALGLAHRVQFTGYLSEERLLDYLARCRAVVFVPKREDYGFVTVEAFASRKAIITAGDSGGPTDLVQNGRNGFVVLATPDGVAVAMAALSEDRALAERLGQQGMADAAHLTWAATVQRLVGDRSKP
jgi:glycosyltransferase involved in cell wall biosynthesis